MMRFALLLGLAYIADSRLKFDEDEARILVVVLIGMLIMDIVELVDD